MNAPKPEPPDLHSESFLHALMARQLKLSVACALTFLLALLGLPLANYFAPDLMATRFAGFTLTWLILGVLFFPFVWIISFVFIRRSMALEKAEVEEVEKAPSSKSQAPEKLQIPTSKQSPDSAALLLVLGAWSFSGAWSLVFGA
jgi:uncharacterized membrane protein (DUF485 family)